MAGLATAQSWSVTVTPQSDSVSVVGGESTSVTVDVNLRGDGFYCAQETDLPVMVSASGAQGISASPDPAELTFTVPPGIHDSNSEPATGPYNETQSASVSITGPSGTAAGFSAQVQVTANFPGGDYSSNDSDPLSSGGCGPSEFNAAEDQSPIDVDVQPDAADGTDGGTDGGDGTDGGTGGNGTDGEDDDNGIPLPTWVVPAGLVSAALMIGRRRG